MMYCHWYVIPVNSLNAMRDNYEKFPNKVLSPKLRQDSVMGIQSMSFSGASTISSKCAIQKHYNMNQQVNERCDSKNWF